MLGAPSVVPEVGQVLCLLRLPCWCCLPEATRSPPHMSYRRDNSRDHLECLIYKAIRIAIVKRKLDLA